jgi:hypothetical protein
LLLHVTSCIRMYKIHRHYGPSASSQPLHFLAYYWVRAVA